jgi:hypothetical protein
MFRTIYITIICITIIYITIIHITIKLYVIRNSMSLDIYTGSDRHGVWIRIYH